MKAKKTVKTAAKPAKKSGKVEGEGSYTATRNYDRGTEEFVRKNRGKIAKMAKDAEKALDGPEGKALRDAEKKAKSKARK